MIRSVVVLVLLSFSVGFTSGSAAQTTLEFHGFRAVTKDGTRFDGREGVLTSRELRAAADDGTVLLISREDLDLLDLQYGSKAAKYALMGGLTGGLFAVAGILSVEANPEYAVRSERVLPFTAAFIGVGAFVGAVIGSKLKKWENVELSAGSPRSTPSNNVMSLTLRF